jgi:hypothetical protein
MVLRHLTTSLKISSPELSWPKRPRTVTPNASASKNSGNRDSVVEIHLLQMQKDAYTAFLQAGIAPETHRGRPGAAFDAAFPIVSHNGLSR